MSKTEGAKLTVAEFKKTVLDDYALAYKSRQASLLGRKEVLTGKAKFGIFGDGKELPQIAMAKVFKNGDFRSGYYRDQTFMMGIGQHTVQEFFAQLYAHTDLEAEPASAGRMMNGHYGTRLLNEDGSWKELKNQKNSSSDISPTAGQMLRLVGLAQASKYYRQNKELIGENIFSNDGNEVAWGTIGNASSSEGHFFESINAAGVLQIPMVISVWDDSFGISVPAKYHTTKESISEILKGFQRDEKGEGFNIFVVNGWDYPELCRVYEEAGSIAREKHIPAIIHVKELTQPQGHSTSGSHERYKSKERLAWEQEYDCIVKFKEWIISSSLATEDELQAIESTIKKEVNDSKKFAWEAYLNPIKSDIKEAVSLLIALGNSTPEVTSLANELSAITEPIRKDIGVSVNKALRLTMGKNTPERMDLLAFKERYHSVNAHRYNSYLLSETSESALNVAEIKPMYSNDSKMMDGREIMQAFFDIVLERDPRVFAFGEDVGKIGDVNQGFAGLQEKYGESRVSDTGIRELTIIGQGIGAALRGLRPIAEIQYLDYLLYGLQPLSDDLATLQYRTKGGQKAPLIVRTRGHRLEGIWHSGSPIGMIINSLRGMHVLVPRDMTQAAGFYNTMLQSDEPALIIECLNGYRLKERMPDNLGTYTVALGIPEILHEGSDVTIVSYGSTLRVVEEAIKQLAEQGISSELIDVQSLLPFDINHTIVESLKKTNKIVFIDEDVPGGATAYMMQQVLETQGGYRYLDAKPLTIAAKPHRPPYGTDGDYFSKPNAEEIFEIVMEMMHDYNPDQHLSFK
ncbi:transketolase [Bacteroidetes bacterium UKL13-3]|nr:transketolase [Bacteroidetes bacterium UKL13-3]HCP94379.1 transketolase [Bacteroidota bacterium]